MACVTKKHGRWAVDFYDQHGKRRLKMLPKGATKAKARELLRDIEEQVGKGTFMPTQRIPTFAKVARDWIEHKRLNLRETTWEVYEGHVRNHFRDLEGLKINRINTVLIEKFIGARQAQGMNISTLRKILVTLNQIMTYAVRHNYIDHNPVRDAERPRDRGGEGEGEEKIKILTPSEISAFLAKVEDQKYHVMFMAAIFSGARQGELLGLKWNDVDWEKSQIHIQRTFNKGRFFTPKTKSSKRKIDLGPRMMEELRKWKLACPANKLDLIFQNNNGNPINYSNIINRHFRPALQAAGLPTMRFHDLRHTYASLQIEKGRNIKYIQSQLGHSTPTVTWNVYAHLMKSANQEAACDLEDMVFGTNGDQMETKTKKGIMVNPITP